MNGEESERKATGTVGENDHAGDDFTTIIGVWHVTGDEKMGTNARIDECYNTRRDVSGEWMHGWMDGCVYEMQRTAHQKRNGRSARPNQCVVRI